MRIQMKTSHGIILLLAILGGMTFGRMSIPAKAGDGQHGEPSVTVALGYDPDTQDKAYRTSIGGADPSTAVATLTSTTTGEALISGKQNVSCEAVFSSASQTSVVDILLLRRDANGKLAHAWWGGPRTLTGSTKAGVTGVSATDPGAIWDTAGATNCRFVVTTGPTTGTMDLWLGSY